MSAIRARIAKLELATSPVVGRFFRFVGGTGDEDEAIAFARAEGFEPTRSDIFLTRTIHRPGEHGPTTVPLALRWVEQSTTAHEDALAQL